MRAGTARRGRSAESLTPRAQALVGGRRACAVNEFTFDLYKAAAAGAAGENVFLSPYSVSTALAMTYAGARGVTEAEMANVLHFAPDVHAGMGALINSINAAPKTLRQSGQQTRYGPRKERKSCLNSPRPCAATTARG